MSMTFQVQEWLVINECGRLFACIAKDWGAKGMRLGYRYIQAPWSFATCAWSRPHSLITLGHSWTWNVMHVTLDTRLPLFSRACCKSLGMRLFHVYIHPLTSTWWYSLSPSQWVQCLPARWLCHRCDASASRPTCQLPAMMYMYTCNNIHIVYDCTLVKATVLSIHMKYIQCIVYNST